MSDHCMRWCVHRAFRRWSFELLGCRTRTRLDSNSCVDKGFFLRVLSLDTSSSTYFPLFQLALRPACTPDSNRRRLSISPPGNHVAFFLAKQVSFEHSISSPSLLLLREGKKNIQTNDRQMTRQKVSPQFVVDRSSARPDRDRVQRCSAATFLNNRKYRYRPLTQPDVAGCWPCATVLPSLTVDRKLREPAARLQIAILWLP